jgi:DNA modification methylase
MAKIEITKTELVWPGKYNEDGTRREVPRVNLPFQVIETINESRATREAKNAPQAALFDIYRGTEGETFEDGWKNKLIWGDNLLVMNSLLEKFSGKVDLIYIDPPFATGADFSFTAQIGEGDVEIEKEQSAIEEKAYRDTWGKGTETYVSMISDRLSLMRNLLSPKGSIYVHCDWHVNQYIRCLLDELFGANGFVNEIAWHYFGFKRKTAKNFPRKHDTILVYGKSDARTWQVQYKPHRPEYVERFKTDKDGRLYRDDVNPTAGGTRVIYLDQVPGDIVDSVWDDIPPVNPVAAERWDYGTQKPEALLKRVIEASSDEGDLVADFFCGSGTTMAVAEKLKRRWIGSDLGRYAIHVSRKRLLELSNSKPFEILNLGKYERQYWQGVTFAEKGKTLSEKALYEYLSFILKLYNGQPVAGLTNLHGKRGRAMVHIGAVDAPVTIDEVNAALAECVQLKQTELHILGWEWEMGINNLLTPEAKKQGVRLLFLQIPREVMEQQAVDKGDIEFFELAYLEVDIEKLKKLAIKIKLKDFVIPNTELIPEEVRAKVKKWSDYIDYWAIDWDFQHDTFMQGWVNYRTRKDRTLALTSDTHTYEKAGRHRVLVKVVDIFGNDTTQAFDVDVK